MRDLITVITATGDRPEAFALCRRWMANQTRQPDQWIVVDDGKTPLVIPPFDAAGHPATYYFSDSGMQYVRREPRADDPRVTLIPNLEAAIPFITGDKILFFEDDEYYAPNYIETMDRCLDGYDIVGIGMSKYYHVRSGRWCQFNNMNHASLAQTGFRKSFFNKAWSLLTGDYMFDVRIWIGANGNGFIFSDLGNVLSVGIKGLPGRPGIGCGHRQYHSYAFDTADREVLRRWIPRDHQFYEGWLKNESC